MDTLLIANRAEIACRIIRSAKRLGIRTVAVATEVDRDARHVREADLAVRIDDYLSIASIIAAAKRTGADAIHPGYGFLAENADLATACDDAQLIFVGPTAAAITLMGKKRAAKEKMIEAGVPCVPGYVGLAQDVDTLTAEAEKIGFPLMVKASAGGGGKGLRMVEWPGQLADQLRLASSEAEAAFGDAELILEKAILQARHVEIQVFADSYGKVIHLGERDCSVQRRHQKIIEESPSPAVSDSIREQMGAAAVEAAKAIGYVGAGTVEFLLDQQDNFYFMEMNTRLQVEHPVTELITDTDLVEWQLDVADGGSIPDGVEPSGHAMEARLYAEDPDAGFLPQTGRIVRLSFPEEIRVDHGLVEGMEVTADYDPMLAKLIAHGRTRDEARRRLIRGLERTVLHGVVTNQRFLIDVLRHEEFATGRATTDFVSEHATPTESPKSLGRKLAAICLAGDGPFWRSTEESRFVVKVDDGGGGEDVDVRVRSGQRFEVGDTTLERIEPDRWVVDGIEQCIPITVAGDRVHLTVGGASMTFARAAMSGSSASDQSDGTVSAPMAGKVVEVRTEAGASVKKGAIVAILEAMKMQLELTAPRDGVVAEVLMKAGDQVATRQVLIRLAGEETA